MFTRLPRPRPLRLPTLCVLLAACLPALAGLARAATPVTPAAAEGGRIVFEIGLATVSGDLADDFNATPQGFGAYDGLELGFQWRIPLGGNLALAPNFHFVNYRDLNGNTAPAGDYRLQTSTLRYGAEIMWRRPGVSRGLRPFLAAGASLDRNRFDGWTKDFAAPLDASVSTLGLSLRAGLRVANIELSAVYGRNRFDSWRFFATDSEQHAVWDTVTFRLGWLLPVK